MPNDKALWRDPALGEGRELDLQQRGCTLAVAAAPASAPAEEQLGSTVAPVAGSNALNRALPWSASEPIRMAPSITHSPFQITQP